MRAQQLGLALDALINTAIEKQKAESAITNGILISGSLELKRPITLGIDGKLFFRAAPQVFLHATFNHTRQSYTFTTTPTITNTATILYNDFFFGPGYKFPIGTTNILGSFQFRIPHPSTIRFNIEGPLWESSKLFINLGLTHTINQEDYIYDSSPWGGTTYHKTSTNDTSLIIRAGAKF